MFIRWIYKSLRTPVADWVLAFLIIAVLALSLAKPVSAAAGSEAVIPAIEIIAVKADESVTIRGHNFPVDVNFTVRMDVAGNMAVDGIVVTEMNSGKGGSFEATYRIPAELRGKKTIAIRLESTRGYYAYDWFNNQTKGSTSGGSTSNPVPATGGKPYLNVVGVKQNESVTVEAFNLPAYTDFRVRVGPFYTFSKDYVQVTTVRSGAAGSSLKFTVNLPDVVKDVDLVTIRMDGSGRYAYNAFHNVTSGSSGTVSPTPAPVTGKFQVVSVSPTVALPKGTDFDAVWTIKNTSGKTWELSTIDYRYVSGTKMNHVGDRYDLNQVVKPGETVKVIVDMTAPNTAGWYTANWELVEGSTVLGSLTVTVRVK